jgi:3-oxoadipate enol-lactonase
VEVEAGGIRIAYDRRGSGPPVVLVHGLGGTSKGIWRHLAGELEGEFAVVAYDLRGAGASAVPPGPYSTDDFVSDLRALVGELRIERPALVGHSFGGTIALAYAAEYPAEVAGVVAVGGPTDLPDAARQGLRDRAKTVQEAGMEAVAETVATNGLAPSFREAHPEEFRAFIRLLAGNDPAGYAATCSAIADLDLRGRLERIEAPVLLVGGDLDGVAPPAAQAETAARIGAARYVEVPDCGHILPWEKPDVLRDEVVRFLGALAPVAA